MKTARFVTPMILKWELYDKIVYSFIYLVCFHVQYGSHGREYYCCFSHTLSLHTWETSWSKGIGDTFPEWGDVCSSELIFSLMVSDNSSVIFSVVLSTVVSSFFFFFLFFPFFWNARSYKKQHKNEYTYFYYSATWPIFTCIPVL